MVLVDVVGTMFVDKATGMGSGTTKRVTNIGAQLAVRYNTHNSYKVYY
jgi:hypothetical protein